MTQNKNNVSIISNIIYKILKSVFNSEENNSKDLGDLKKILIVRQHNQFGDLLANSSLFRALKEKYPKCHITLIVSPANYYGIIKNNFIDNYFVFNKRKLFNIIYLIKFIKLLRSGYDLAIVPVTVSISFTSNFIAGISKSRSRLGCESLNGIKNNYSFLFDRRIRLNWNKHPDSHVSDFVLEIVKPFGISTKNFNPVISYDQSDVRKAEKFIEAFKLEKNKKIIGLHVGAGKIPNRWSLIKYVELIKKIDKQYESIFYLTGSDADKEEVDYVFNNLFESINVIKYLNKSIPEVAALISLSDLFITNDTGIMHVAGSTSTKQISIFGPTNPFNWAPIGNNKYFIRKSEFIDDIQTAEVYNLVIKFLDIEHE